MNRKSPATATSSIAALQPRRLRAARFTKDDGPPPEETPATSLRGAEKPQAAPGVVLSSRKPEVLPEVLRSAPPGARELSIPAANRGPLTDTSKTPVFRATYKSRPAAITVTTNERGQLVNAYVSGALANVVSKRVLMTKKKQQRSGMGGPSRNDPMRQPEEGDAEAAKTLGENLGDMKCASSAVAKTVLEALDYSW